MVVSKQNIKSSPTFTIIHSVLYVVSEHSWFLIVCCTFRNENWMAAVLKLKHGYSQVVATI